MYVCVAIIPDIFNFNRRNLNKNYVQNITIYREKAKYVPVVFISFVIVISLVIMNQLSIYKSNDDDDD